MISNLTWKGRSAEPHVFITESPVGKLASGSTVNVIKECHTYRLFRSAQNSKPAVQERMHRSNLSVSTV